MFNRLKRIARDTLTRNQIDSGVRHFARLYCKQEDKVYDIGGGRYNYNRYFQHYFTVNMDPTENPDFQSDAEKLPFSSNSLDAALCIAVLEHVNNPEKVLGEIYRTLKPEGNAFIWVPFYWREHRYPIDHQRFTVEGLFYLINKTGFVVKEITSKPYSGFFFLVSHDIRFIMRDPHVSSLLNPLLYLHALACVLSKIDKVFNLYHPTLYTGVEAMVQKPAERDQNG